MALRGGPVTVHRVAAKHGAVPAPDGEGSGRLRVGLQLRPRPPGARLGAQSTARRDARGSVGHAAGGRDRRGDLCGRATPHGVARRHAWPRCRRHPHRHRHRGHRSRCGAGRGLARGASGAAQSDRGVGRGWRLARHVSAGADWTVAHRRGWLAQRSAGVRRHRRSDRSPGAGDSSIGADVADGAGGEPGRRIAPQRSTSGGAASGLSGDDCRVFRVRPSAHVHHRALAVVPGVLRLARESGGHGHGHHRTLQHGRHLRDWPARRALQPEAPPRADLSPPDRDDRRVHRVADQPNLHADVRLGNGAPLARGRSAGERARGSPLRAEILRHALWIRLPQPSARLRSRRAPRRHRVRSHALVWCRLGGVDRRRAPGFLAAVAHGRSAGHGPPVTRALHRPPVTPTP